MSADPTVGPEKCCTAEAEDKDLKWLLQICSGPQRATEHIC